MTGPFSGSADIGLTFPDSSTSSYNMGGFVLLDDSIISFNTDLTSLGDIEALSLRLGQPIIVPGGTKTIHVTNIGLNTIRLVLYNQVDGIYDTIPSDMSRSFSVIVQAPPLRVNISPERGVTYNEPTIFEIYYPYEYGGLVVLGDAALPTEYLGSMYEANNKGDFIYAENTVRISISEPTRVRLYYYPSMAYHGYYYDLDTYFDDFIINVQSAPNVLVENYGKSVSFDYSTTVRLVSNIPCELTYSIIDLEDKLQSLDVVARIDDSLHFDIVLYASTLLKYRARANNKVTELKEYFFLREPATAIKKSYSYFISGGQLTNNLYNDQFFGPIISNSYGEGNPTIDPSQVMQIGQFDFSPITNSFIAGNHPAYTRPHIGGWNYEFTNYGLNSINAIYAFRLHYKFVGLSYYVNNCRAYIYIAGTTINAYVDSDGWLIGLGKYNDGIFDCSFNKPSGIIADAYLEIDYFEVLPISAFTQLYNFELTAQNRFNTTDTFETISQIPVFNTPEDPVFVLAVTSDGSTPDIVTNAITNIENYNGNQSFVDHISTINNLTLFQRIYYQGYLADALVPSIHTERISKIVNGETAFLQTFEANVEDFKLGSTKFNWSIPNWQQENKRFRFLPEGLVSPKIYDGQATIVSQWFYNITGRHVTIEYEVKLAPGCYQFNGYAQVIISNAYSMYTNIYNHGSGIISTGLYADYTQITINFYSYAYMQGGSSPSPTDQYITIKRIEFLDRKRQDVNTAELILGEETWPNDVPTWPWIFNGSWGPAPGVNSPYDNTYFLVPPNIGDSEYAAMSYTVDCIDGNVEFYFGISSEQDCDFCNFYIDSVQVASISGAVDPTFYSFYVTLGTHTFNWEFIKDGSTSVGADTPFITDIRFPILSGVVLNETTQGQFAYTATGTYYAYAWTWEKGSTFLNYRPKGFGATISAYSYDSKSMSVTLPLDTTSGRPSIYFNMSVVATGNTYYYPVNLTVTCNWDSVYTDGSHTYEIFNGNLQYTGGYYPGPRNLPSPIPETGTITFTLTGSGAPFDTSVYFPSISIPTPVVNIIDINPKEDIPSLFPVSCSMSICSTNFDVFYTLDNTDPETSSTAVKYIGPITITESSKIKYRPYNKQSSSWGQLEIKLYLEKPFHTCEILKHVYVSNSKTYVVFFTIPWQVPILIGEITDGMFKTRLYDGLPIVTNPGHIFTIGHVTILGEPCDNQFTNEFHYNVDYNSFRLMTIASEVNNDWPRSIEFTGAVEQEAQGFSVRAISSIPSGVYNHPIRVALRSNFPECEIYYTIEEK